MAKQNNIWLFAALGVGAYLFIKNQQTVTDPATGATATPAPPVSGPSNLTTVPPIVTVTQPVLPPNNPVPAPPQANNPVVVPANQLNNTLPTSAQIAAQGINVTNGPYIDVAAAANPSNYDSNPAATHGSMIPPQYQSGHS
jgi:hypothetical protein